MQQTNFQFHCKGSKVIAIILPWARWSCYSKSQTDIYNFFVNKGISCISTNYIHQDKKEKFFMAENFIESKESLYKQVLQFWEDIDSQYNYETIILIWTSLWGVLFNHLIDKFWSRVKHFFILWYLTGYIKPERLISPTTIIQGEYDKYGGIQIVKENVGNSDMTTFFEISNTDHSYFDINNPSIRKNNEACDIIFNTLDSLISPNT